MATPAHLTSGIRALRVGAVLVVAGIALVACGSSSSGGSSGNSTVTPSAQTSSATTPASTPGTSTPAVSGAAFCKYAKTEKSKVAAEEKAFAVDSPAQLQKIEQEALTAVTELAANAPAAVKSDVTLVVTTDEKVFNDFKAVHYDFAKLNPRDLSTLDTPAFANAGRAIATYFGRVCSKSA
jgi:hypothetical protein